MQSSANILVVGGGGREHAISSTVAMHPAVHSVFVMPGNGAVEAKVHNVEMTPSKDNFEKIVDFIKGKTIKLVIVGPEVPLVDGLVDFFNAELPDVLVFGPSAAAAQLEGSKYFAKQFMTRHGIPTSTYTPFNSTTKEDAIAFFDTRDVNEFVIKFSGLAAGKGVHLPTETGVAKQVVTDLLDSPDAELIIEQKLFGEEVSVFALCSGEEYMLLPVMQDYKRALDNDAGPNTGGMGAHTVTLPPEIMKKIERQIVKPTVDGCVKDGFPFVGVIYFGLMLTEEGPKVIEYNCRFGDPEAEVLLPMLGDQVYIVLKAAAAGTLGSCQPVWPSLGTTGMTVVLTSAGYPGKYTSGEEITVNKYEISKMQNLFKETGNNVNIKLFHAGTKAVDVLRTAGGRVMCVTVIATDFSPEKLIETCYKVVEFVDFKGKQLRGDIGYKMLKH